MWIYSQPTRICFGGGSRETRAQRVAGVSGGIEAGAGGQAFDDFGELVVAKRFGGDFSAPAADRREEIAVGDVGAIEPGGEGANRAAFGV